MVLQQPGQILPVDLAQRHEGRFIARLRGGGQQVGGAPVDGQAVRVAVDAVLPRQRLEHRAKGPVEIAHGTERVEQHRLDGNGTARG